MVIRDELLNIWELVHAHLPPDFDAQKRARERRAFLRKRNVKDVASLFRLAMAYGGCGMSLRETCAWAEALGRAVLAVGVGVRGGRGRRPRGWRAECGAVIPTANMQKPPNQRHPTT